MARKTRLRIFNCFIVFTLFFVGFAANAATISWTDWKSSSVNSDDSFTGLGTITTSTSTVNVTYNNPQGVAFFTANGGTDYWTDSSRERDATTSPYTSDFVENIPTGTDIIGLQYAGTQSLTFSEAIANPVFSYVSLNGNGYAFDQDFELLSVGGADGNECGYWGCGTSYKNVVALEDGNYEYQLLGTGEPHGTLRFTGAFDTVTWRSLSDESWNGFTVGVEGTAEEILPSDGNPVPEPSTILLLGSGLAGLVFYRRKRK